MMIKKSLSVVCPAYNEAGNLSLLVKKINQELKKLTLNYQIIVVDDGSTDNSFNILKKLKTKYSRLMVIRLRRRSGQTSALMAGFSQSRGDIIITFDSDMQQDPKDIKKLITPIIKGEADIVSGNRNKRKHSNIYKFITWIQSILNRKLLGIKLYDTSVSPNAYKASTLDNLNLYGEMHRFLVPILHWRGYKVIEIPVSHHKRHRGVSKYKPSKAITGFLDLTIVKFWQDYSSKSIHVFGVIGLTFMAIGTIIGIEEAVRKLFFHQSIINRSLPLFAVFTVILGSQFLVFGILADILIRVYYKGN